MKKFLFIVISVVSLFSCNIEKTRTLNESIVRNEFVISSSPEFLTFHCEYKDSSFNIVIQEDVMFIYVNDSLFFSSDSTKMGSSVIEQWTLDRNDPIILNDYGYQCMKDCIVNDSIVSNLQKMDLTKYLNENCYNATDKDYVFGYEGFTTELAYVLLERGYRIYIDSETGYICVSRK